MEAMLRDDAGGRTFEVAPESVLPCQLTDQLFTGAHLQPEKRLQLAVLEDAVLTFHRCVGVERRRAQRLFAEVDDWFSSNDTSSPFSFQTICDSLGIDPDYVRAGLRRWRAPRPVGAARKPPLRRIGGTRHHVVLYSTRLKKSA